MFVCEQDIFRRFFGQETAEEQAQRKSRRQRDQQFEWQRQQQQRQQQQQQQQQSRASSQPRQPSGDPADPGGYYKRLNVSPSASKSEIQVPPPAPPPITLPALLYAPQGFSSELMRLDFECRISCGQCISLKRLRLLIGRRCSFRADSAVPSSLQIKRSTAYKGSSCHR